MLLALIYGFARFAVDLLLIRRGTDQSLRLEVMALRHQLRVLERQVGRPRWQTSDRLLLAALSRHLLDQTGGRSWSRPKRCSGGIGN